jgi:hypothetical protein
VDGARGREWSRLPAHVAAAPYFAVGSTTPWIPERDDKRFGLVLEEIQQEEQHSQIGVKLPQVRDHVRIIFELAKHARELDISAGHQATLTQAARGRTW